MFNRERYLTRLSELHSMFGDTPYHQIMNDDNYLMFIEYTYNNYPNQKYDFYYDVSIPQVRKYGIFFNFYYNGKFWLESKMLKDRVVFYINRKLSYQERYDDFDRFFTRLAKKCFRYTPFLKIRKLRILF